MFIFVNGTLLIVKSNFAFAVCDIRMGCNFLTCVEYKLVLEQTTLVDTAAAAAEPKEVGLRESSFKPTGELPDAETVERVASLVVGAFAAQWRAASFSILSEIGRAHV